MKQAAELSEDEFRETLNEMTRLMGSAIGSAGAERLKQLSRLIDGDANEFPQELENSSPRRAALEPA